jgi:hypothetical protein
MALIKKRTFSANVCIHSQQLIQRWDMVPNWLQVNHKHQCLGKMYTLVMWAWISGTKAPKYGKDVWT